MKPYKIAIALLVLGTTKSFATPTPFASLPNTLVVRVKADAANGAKVFDLSFVESPQRVVDAESAIALNALADEQPSIRFRVISGPSIDPPDGPVIYRGPDRAPPSGTTERIEELDENGEVVRTVTIYRGPPIEPAPLDYFYYDVAPGYSLYAWPYGPAPVFGIYESGYYYRFVRTFAFSAPPYSYQYFYNPYYR